MKILSLYSGICGFELGILCAGLEHIFEPAHFVEMDSYCQSVISKWFPSVPITSLIQDFKPTKKYDIVTAGFPCQPHTLAGLQQGTNDSRDLWDITIETIKKVKPKAFILENVPGLRYTHQGTFFKRVLRDIAEAGYNAQWDCVAATSVGAVHRRSRIFIIAYSPLVGQSRNEGATKTGTDNTSSPANTSILSAWLQAKSKFCGKDDGIPTGMDWLLSEKDLSDALLIAADCENNPLRKHQIRALGNAIVPQVAALIWKELYNILNEYSIS